jgi:Rrf2 family nitric oxide-sensitive transcriptional repressor
MQLTRYTDYSLRVLIYLAITQETTTIANIAARYRISENHLVKVVHNLGKLGYVETVRGRSGGVRLAGDPESIRVGEVVRQVEPNFDLLECFNVKENTCPILPACKLRVVLGQAQQAFMAVLDEYTLATFLSERVEIARLLNLDLPD